jgi:paraquat-inducible protein A
VWIAAAAATAVCPRCGTPLHQRIPNSLQRVLAWLAVGLMCYVPANLLPMLKTRTLGRERDNTIVGGVIELLHHGAWDVGLIVFTASVVIPVTKFVVIVYLVLSIRYRVTLDIHTRIHLYDAVEFIGRWSMIDVFVVAILTALVQLGFIVSINPGPAAIFFALSVAFTMLSAQALDPRLIWDTERETSAHG